MASSFDTFPEEEKSDFPDPANNAVSFKYQAVRKQSSSFSSHSSRSHRERKHHHNRYREGRDRHRSPSGEHRHPSVKDSSRAQRTLRQQSQSHSSLSRTQDPSLHTVLRDYFIDRRGDDDNVRLTRLDRRHVPRYVKPKRSTAPLGSLGHGEQRETRRPRADDLMKARVGQLQHRFLLLPAVTRSMMKQLERNPSSAASDLEFIPFLADDEADGYELGAGENEESSQSWSASHQKYLAMGRRLQSITDRIDLWLEWIAYPWILYRENDSLSMAQTVTHSMRTVEQVIQRQIHSCDRALRAHNRSEPLMVLRLQLANCASQLGVNYESKIADDANTWRSMVDTYPNYGRLRLYYLQCLAQSFHEDFYTCLDSLTAHMEPARRHNLSSEDLVSLVIRALSWFWSAGYRERSIAILLGQCAINMLGMSAETVGRDWDVVPSFLGDWPEARRYNRNFICRNWEEWFAEEKASLSDPYPVRTPLASQDTDSETIILFEDLQPFLLDRSVWMDPNHRVRFVYLFFGFLGRNWWWPDSVSTNDTLLNDIFLKDIYLASGMVLQDDALRWVKAPCLLESFAFFDSLEWSRQPGSQSLKFLRVLVSYLVTMSKGDDGIVEWISGLIAFECCQGDLNMSYEWLDRIVQSRPRLAQICSLYRALVLCLQRQSNIAKDQLQSLLRSPDLDWSLSLRATLWYAQLELQTKGDPTSFLLKHWSMDSVAYLVKMLEQRLRSADESSAELYGRLLMLVHISSQDPLDQWTKVVDMGCSVAEEITFQWSCLLLTYANLWWPSRPQCFAPRLLRPWMEEGLKRFPRNHLLLHCFLANEQCMKIENRGRFFLDRLLISQPFVERVEIQLARLAMEKPGSLEVRDLCQSWWQTNERGELGQSILWRAAAIRMASHEDWISVWLYRVLDLCGRDKDVVMHFLSCLSEKTRSSCLQDVCDRLVERGVYVKQDTVDPDD